jgi:endonuclease/exonuclease/phosphatase family metal-dependent hydrolase
MTRIGTWNMAGRWSLGHGRFLHDLDADVLLLTEVPRAMALDGYVVHLSCARMAARRAWAAVLSRRPLSPCPDPHPASAMAEVDGIRYCSSILPWRSAGSRPIWPGERHAEWTSRTVDALRESLRPPAVWGGDFNHALTGREWSGSKAGRESIASLLQDLDLQTPTAHLGHRLDGLLSIDHIAVPAAWHVREASRHDATGLSDHAGYLVEVEPVAAEGPVHSVGSKLAED